LSDESGFTISGTDHVFKFEKDGGWYDEFDNYYDRNGNYVPEGDDDYEDEDKQFGLGYDIDG